MSAVYYGASLKCGTPIKLFKFVVAVTFILLMVFFLVSSVSKCRSTYSSRVWYATFPPTGITRTIRGKWSKSKVGVSSPLSGETSVRELVDSLAPFPMWVSSVIALKDFFGYTCYVVTFLTRGGPFTKRCPSRSIDYYLVSWVASSNILGPGNTKFPVFDFGA